MFFVNISKFCYVWGEEGEKREIGHGVKKKVNTGKILTSQKKINHKKALRAFSAAKLYKKSFFFSN